MRRQRMQKSEASKNKVDMYENASENQNSLTNQNLFQKIKPQRFVWHLSPRKNRKSILKQGLIAALSSYGCVFANNQSRDIDFFYPFCVYLYYGDFTQESYLAYDYWKIDTSMIKADWFIDPNMANGPEEYMGTSRNFIFTEASIPPEALTLHKIDSRFVRKYTITGVMYEIEDGDREIYYYGSKEKIDYSKKILEITEIQDWDICRIQEEIGDGVASFIVNDLPLVIHDIYKPFCYKKVA